MKRTGVFAITLIAILFLTTKAYSQTYSYYLPYFIGHTNHWTGIGLRNCSSTSTATVNVFVYDTSGNLSGSGWISVDADGHAVFTVGDGYPNEGWIKITSTQPLVGLCFVATTGAENYMADIPFASELSTLLYIPHVGQGPVYDTSVMVCNPNPSATTVTLTFVDQQGNPLYEKSQLVNANGSWKYELKNLLDSSTSNYGSIEISASNGLAAFALYNNLKKGGYSYAGISAVVPPGSEQECPIIYEQQVFESKIWSDFDGYESGNIYELMNGQIWKQIDYKWEWDWAYLPWVVVYKTSAGTWKMMVEGMSEAVIVERLQ